MRVCQWGAWGCSDLISSRAGTKGSGDKWAQEDVKRLIKGGWVIHWNTRRGPVLTWTHLPRQGNYPERVWSSLTVASDLKSTFYCETLVPQMENKGNWVDGGIFFFAIKFHHSENKSLRSWRRTGRMRHRRKLTEWSKSKGVCKSGNFVTTSEIKEKGSLLH